MDLGIVIYVFDATSLKYVPESEEMGAKSREVRLSECGFLPNTRFRPHSNQPVSQDLPIQSRDL
jgi:hypothetical protein